MFRRPSHDDPPAASAEGALRLAPCGTTVAARVALAQGLLCDGQVAAALAELEIALREDPELAEGQLLHGLALAAQRRYREALSPLSSALEFDDDPRLASIALALVFHELGDHVQSLRTIDAQVVRDPSDPVSHALRGLALQKAGQTAAALAALTRAVELDPGLWGVHVRFAELLIDENRSDEAADHLRAAEALAPADPRVHRAWGELHARGQRWNDAFSAYRVAIEYSRPDGSLLLAFGRCCLALDKHIEATMAARRALELDPRNPQPRQLLAQVLTATGRPAEAALFAAAAERLEAPLGHASGGDG